MTFSTRRTLQSWIRAEIEFVRANWHRLNDAELGAALRRSMDSVKTIRLKLGLKRPINYKGGAKRYIRQ
jgi:hypothetical protein